MQNKTPLWTLGGVLLAAIAGIVFYFQTTKPGDEHNVITSDLANQPTTSPVASGAPTQHAMKTKRYINQFYSFDYLEDFTLEKEKVVDTHTPSVGDRDLFGKTQVDFILNGPSPTEDIFSLNVYSLGLNSAMAVQSSPKEDMAAAKKRFNEQAQADDMFREVDVAGYPAYYEYFPANTDPAQEEGVDDRLGLIRARIFSSPLQVEFEFKWINRANNEKALQITKTVLDTFRVEVE